MPDQPNPKNVRRTRITRANVEPVANRSDDATPANDALKTAKVQIATLSQQIEALQKESSEKVGEAQKQLLAARQQNKTITEQSNALKKQVTEAEQEKKSLLERVAALEKDSSEKVLSVQKQLSEAVKEKSSLSERITLLQKEGSERLAATQKALQEIKQEKATISEQAIALKNQVAETERERKILSEKVSLLESQTQGRVAAAQKREKELEKENKTLTQQITEQSTRIAEYEKSAEKAAKERQRLTLLESKLQESDKKVEALAAAADASKASEIKSLQKKLASLENEKASLSEQVTGLIGENRRLAEEVAPFTADTQRFQDIATKSAEELRQARLEIETVTKLRAELERKVKSLETQQGRLEAQALLQTRQLAEQGKTPLMSPAKVAEMVSNLNQQLSASMTGMAVRDGELRLKVAVGAAGESEGFVVPTIDSSPEIRDNLHEVVVRFDRSAPVSSD